MKKRLIAFLLVLIMVLGMLPVSAMAAGSVVTARGSAENPIRIYENSGNQAETSNGSVQVPVGETVTDSGVLTFSTYSAIEGVQVSKSGVYCVVTSSNENVVKATGSWSGGVLTINFLGVGNGTAKITVDYTCTCSKNAVANGLLIYNVTVGDGGSTDPSGKPNAPTASDIGAFPDAGKAVLLHCVDAGVRGHDATASSLNKVQNGYSVGEVVENPGTYYNVDGGKITKEQFPWMCVVTVHAAPFIELYNSNFSERYGVHKLAGTSNATATLHWFWHNTYGWQYLENPPIQFNITRDTSEKTYTLNYYKNTTDTVTNMPEPNPQTEKSNTGMVTFTVSNARPSRDGYTFLGWAGNPDATTATVKPGNTITTPRETTNLYASGSRTPPPTDKPADPTLKGYTFAFWYLGEDEQNATAYDFNTPVTENITLTAKWNINKYTVAFDSYGGTPVPPAQEVEYGLTATKPADPTLKGYTFAFWYLGEDEQNATAYDFDTPVTENITLTAKWNINKYTVAFDSYGGTPVPPAQEVEYGLTATEPAAPEKTGYTFDGWYLGDEKYDFSAAVEQNITLTAKWHITPHNIYAYARLNSYFAPLTTSEFDTPVTLNEATLSRLGLGSYNSLGYISIGSFDFDAMPLTSDLYFGEDAELAAALAKLAQSIALETGVSDKIAEKIAWTALYKTVNEEDMAPGYPADDGYQLSGNLNLATVMFKAGGENVTGMPAVNYTYDDILEIHDFYFAGDTFTMPADPTREGYSFEGWSVKVIPDENDADHLDADGTDDAADETLLKAGDTYTITAGGVIFTAQWEKKTFTVKYYLPDETGAWVEKKMDTVDSVDYATYSLWTPNAEDGYEFSGWYQKPADIGVKAKVEKLYMAKEWKLYGKFTPIEYTIQYVYNDGKATSTNPTTYTVESDTITLADATGADWGKTFLEWHDENGQKITEIPTGSTGDRVITAYWNWPVHLHYLDKDNNEIESATLYVSELEPGACVLPTGEKTGYDFDGWYEAKKDIGTASHKLNALSIAKKWELYGRYTAKTDVSYTVKYLREGDNKVLAPEKVVTDQTFDTEVTEQAADVVGYTPDAPSKTMILDEYNKVLTFSYSANTYDYTVRHIKQLPDGSYDEANAEVETLSGKFEALAAVTAKDYGSHYPTNDADTKQNIKIEKGLTIDVKYDLDEHTLTFETNGGSAVNPVTVRHGNAVARPADPTKDKYTFIGWYADPEFTEEYDFATVLEADKTIYAKFELTSTPIGDIYVRYDVLHIKQLPDGTYDLANAEVEHLSAKKDTTVTAVIKDYRATHHVNVNRTLSKLTGAAIQPYRGVDGKPVYTILSVYYDLDFHTLTFDTMGGSKIAPETVRHGLTVAKPKDPVNGGYIFDGWYTDKTFRHRYDFSTPLTEDITIYAKWFLIVLPGVTVKKNTPKLNTADHFAYVQGYPDGTVKPAGNITRAETAAILFRLMDDASRKTYYSTKSGFRDVASGSWYNTYVATLNNAGVITDSSNGYFRPNEAITRAELAAMLAKFSETTGAANYFNDVSAKYWAANAIAICAKLGWITGYPDGTFRPDKNVTRAELMAMINRATGRAPKSADAFLPGMKTWIDNTADKWYYLDVQEATNSHSYTVKGSETWTALTSDPNWSLYE